MSQHVLNKVFSDAIKQAEFGKGAERHKIDDNFYHDPLIKITDITGLNGPFFQVIKKTQEAISCRDRGVFTTTQAYNEVLGAIVYLGSIALMLKDEIDDEDD